MIVNQVRKIILQVFINNLYSTQELFSACMEHYLFVFDSKTEITIFTCQRRILCKVTRSVLGMFELSFANSHFGFDQTLILLSSFSFVAVLFLLCAVAKLAVGT